jgi:hypothetical protein
MMGGNTPAVPDMSDARITNDELDAILAEVKEMWAALIDVARMVPGSADIVEPRSKLPEVVAMVFDQAKVVSSETRALDLLKEARPYLDLIAPSVCKERPLVMVQTQCDVEALAKRIDGLIGEQA